MAHLLFFKKRASWQRSKDGAQVEYEVDTKCGPLEHPKWFVHMVVAFAAAAAVNFNNLTFVALILSDRNIPV